MVRPKNWKRVGSLIGVGNAAPNILRAGDHENFLVMKWNRDADDLFTALDRRRAKITTRTCYCSVFDDCWVCSGVSAEAEKIVTAEVEKYHQHLERREVVPAIVALQENAEAVRQLELARAAKRLGSLTAEQQAAVEALTRSLTAKLLHPQIVDLRKKSEER